MKNLVVSLSLALVATAASAQTSPLQLDRAVSTLASGNVTLQTLPMPKGWFSSQNALDRNKTDLRTTYAIAASGCLPALDEAVSSRIVGTFAAVLNSQGKPTAWIWNYVHDVSAAANHWHYHVGCDGVQRVEGCPESRAVVATTTAFGQDGQCLTYTAADGTVACASDTLTFELTSVQDATLTDTACQDDGGDASCGIGPCTSACEHDCDAQFPVLPVPRPHGSGADDGNAGARLACKHACVCSCKALRPPACPADPECAL